MPDGTPIKAQAPDGTMHIFPAGTDPAIVDKTMKAYITGGAGTGMTPSAAVGAMSAIGRGAQSTESEEGGFFSGLAGSATKLHPIEAIKNAYASIKDYPLDAGIALLSGTMKAGLEMAGIPVNLKEDLTEVAKQQAKNPNVGAFPFQLAQALSPQLKTALPLGSIASAPNTANAIGQGASAALGVIAMIPEDAALKSVPSITRGVAPGATKTTQWLERILGKFPTSGALDQAYARNQSILRATLSNAVADSVAQEVPEALRADVMKAGVKLGADGRPIINMNPDEIVGNFEKGSKALESIAKANYAPLDTFVKQNKPRIINWIDENLPDIARNDKEFINRIGQEPIVAVKTKIAQLNNQGQRLEASGMGALAHQSYQQADTLTKFLGDIKNEMSSELQAHWAKADEVWHNKSALEDIAEVLKDPSVVHGAPPSAQNALTKTQQQTVAGANLLREATMGDKAARFQQVFGEGTTKQITDLADLIGKQQALRGQGQGGIGGIMMGAGFLLGALRGGPTGALGPLVGMDLMTRAMASPNNWALIKAMFTSNPMVIKAVIAPRIIDNMRQNGELPDYLYAPSAAPVQQPVPTPQAPAPPMTGNATIGEQLRAKGKIPQAPPNQPGKPFDPGAGLR